MSEHRSRREAVKQLGSAGAGLLLAGGFIRGRREPIQIAGMPVEISVAAIGRDTIRITAAAIVGTGGVPDDGALVRGAEVAPVARRRDAGRFASVSAGGMIVRYTPDPPTLHVETARRVPVQRLVFSASEPGMSFRLPKGPLLGLGEGGPQFDRKGSRSRSE